MGNSFAIHGLRDEAAHERDVDIRQVRVGARPDENNKKSEAKTPKTAESHITPLLYDAPFPGNTREYPHKSYIVRI